MTLLGVPDQLQPGCVSLPSLVWELAIGEDADDVVVVAIDDRLRGVHV